MQTETAPTIAALTPEIVRLCEAYMAADHAMRDAIDRDHGAQERAHRTMDREHERVDAALAALGAKIGLLHQDPENGCRMCGVDVDVAGPAGVAPLRTGDWQATSEDIDRARAWAAA